MILAGQNAFVFKGDPKMSISFILWCLLPFADSHFICMLFTWYSIINPTHCSWKIVNVIPHELKNVTFGQHRKNTSFSVVTLHTFIFYTYFWWHGLHFIQPKAALSTSPLSFDAAFYAHSDTIIRLFLFICGSSQDPQTSFENICHWFYMASKA